jgi:hypothetical protein
MIKVQSSRLMQGAHRAPAAGGKAALFMLYGWTNGLKLLRKVFRRVRFTHQVILRYRRAVPALHIFDI